MKYQPSICSHQMMPASMNKLANLGDYVFDNGYIYHWSISTNQSIYWSPRRWIHNHNLTIEGFIQWRVYIDLIRSCYYSKNLNSRFWNISFYSSIMFLVHYISKFNITKSYNIEHIFLIYRRIGPWHVGYICI